MRLARLAQLSPLALVTAALAIGCSPRQGALVDAGAQVAPAVAPDAAEPVAPAPVAAVAAAPSAVMGRVLDTAKSLAFVLTSNVMGELEPCG